MSYIATSITGLLGFFAGKSKAVFIAAAALAVILIGFNCGNPDYLSYGSAYDTGVDIYHVSQASEPVWLALVQACRFLGLDYQAFRVVVGLIGVTLIAKTVYDFSPYPAFALCLYLVYPLFVDVVQLRSFLMAAVVVFAFRFVIGYKSTGLKRNVVFFIAALLIAMGLHYSGAFFFLLLVLFLDLNAHKILVVVVIPTGIVCLAVFADVIIPMLGDVPAANKIAQWITAGEPTSARHALRVIVMRGGMVAVLAVLFHLADKPSGGGYSKPSRTGSCSLRSAISRFSRLCSTWRSARSSSGCSVPGCCSATYWRPGACMNYVTGLPPLFVRAPWSFSGHAHTWPTSWCSAICRMAKYGSKAFSDPSSRITCSSERANDGSRDVHALLRSGRP